MQVVSGSTPQLPVSGLPVSLPVGNLNLLKFICCYYSDLLLILYRRSTSAHVCQLSTYSYQIKYLFKFIAAVKTTVCYIKMRQRVHSMAYEHCKVKLEQKNILPLLFPPLANKQISVQVSYNNNYLSLFFPHPVLLPYQFHFSHRLWKELGNKVW